MIILTEKDADWMASVCREKLESAEMAYHEAFAKLNKLKTVSDEFFKTQASEEEKEEHGVEVNKYFYEAKNQLDSDWTDIKTVYTRMLELLMSGSELLGEKENG